MAEETESAATLLARKEYARAVPLLKRDLEKYPSNPRIRGEVAGLNAFRSPPLFQLVGIGPSRVNAGRRCIDDPLDFKRRFFCRSCSHDFLSSSHLIRNFRFDEFSQ